MRRNDKPTTTAVSAALPDWRERVTDARDLLLRDDAAADPAILAQCLTELRAVADLMAAIMPAELRADLGRPTVVCLECGHRYPLSRASRAGCHCCGSTAIEGAEL